MQALKNSGQNNQNKETPMEILKRRYANGEIDEEEFNKRKKELLK
ncbi:SHOCT domain-containing protein [Aliifodinibius salipaludis]|nr:SHOCT domain-containing protein [Aliifodinibius salipaludis]